MTDEKAKSEVSGKPVLSDTYKPDVDENVRFGGMVSDQMDAVEGLTSPQLKAIFNEVNQFNEELVPKMPEALFVGHFLRALAGLDEDTDGRVFLFYKGGNGLHYPVDVVDPVGNVLFRVPPLYQTKHINPLVKGDNTPGMASVIQASSLLAHVRPQEALDSAAAIMARKAVRANRSGFRYEQSEKEWMAIFERYGIAQEVKNKMHQMMQDVGLVPKTEPAPIVEPTKTPTDDSSGDHLYSDEF